MQNNKEILVEHLKNELRKRHFWKFCQFFDPEFFENRPFLKDIADAFVLQKAPNSPEVQKLVKIHYNWVSVFWTPTKDAYIGLGQMYVSDERFTQNYDKYAPGCAAFMAQAMDIYAQENLSN